jgi:hypothetical protein
MSLINQLFKGRERARKSGDQSIMRQDREAAAADVSDGGNRSFTYRPTGSEGVKSTSRSHDRDARHLK